MMTRIKSEKSGWSRHIKKEDNPQIVLIEMEKLGTYAEPPLDIYLGLNIHLDELEYHLNDTALGHFLMLDFL